jgi:hypothetical protein
MKYYENYTPAYSFIADFSDPITRTNIQVKFYNDTGTILFGHPP